MRWKIGRLVGMAAIVVATMGQVQAPDSLALARQAYNGGKFDDAIAAATEALKTTTLANAAAVVLARAHLERYRLTAAVADLDQARSVLRLVTADQLAPRDRVEFLLALGVSLYVEGCESGCFSAAAEMFRLALAGAESSDDRERVFEWWAASLDRQARAGHEIERLAIYRRIVEGAEAELAREHQSASASFWLPVAARGTGELERAWGASIAAWIRARGLGRRGEVLRTDLDRFVTQILLPERARQQSPDIDARPALELLKQQWEEMKKKYL